MAPKLSKYALVVESAFKATDSDYSIAQLIVGNDWLVEATTPPVARLIEETISSLRNKQPEYEPLLFDLYIGEAAAAIDRCLSLRREIQEIESSALMHARQHVRFKKTLSVNKALDETADQESQAIELGAKFVESANEFPDSSLGPALKIQALGLANAQESASSELNRRGTLLARRWKILDEITEADMALHNVPGHVLNFNERRDRYLKLLEQDLTEAWKKCIAVNSGLELVFGDDWNSDLPDEAESNALDLLLFWARGAIDFLDSRREREIEFDLTVPFVQPASDRDDVSFTIGGDIADVKNGNMLFDVTPWLEKVFGESDGNKRMASLRVRSIGASVSIADPKAVATKSLTYPIVVFPPTVARPLDESMVNRTVRPPVILNARPESAEGVSIEMESGSNIRNHPVAGEWRVKFVPPATNTSAAAVSIKTSSVIDFKLHLRLIGNPLNQASGW